MRSTAWFGFVIIAIATTHSSAPAYAQTSDDSLRIYAVNVVKTPPFQKQFTGDGVYLGQGLVVTAAHVVGHWPFFTHPRVLIAGQYLPAKVVKEGSFEQTDLALLSVDQDRLPVSLRLRRNPLCKDAPTVGMEVIDVVPDETTRSRTISPLLIAPALQRRFGTLISNPEESGSGLFDAARKCLLGIMSAKVEKYDYHQRSRSVIGKTSDFAGYFVPASEIADFIPPDFRF
jgi:hypothetical protein